MDKDDELYLKVAELVGVNSSTCLSRKVGAVIRTNKCVLTSYNGAPKDKEQCVDMGYCTRKKGKYVSGKNLDKCRAIHAEQYAIMRMKLIGESCVGATMYVNTQPCDICAEKIIQAGIIKVVYREDYPHSNSLGTFKSFGVEVIKL